MPAFDVLAVGDLNIDLILGVNALPEFGREVLAGSLSQHAGGVAANFASYCVRLGLKVALVARVGRDDFGDFLLARMAEIGVCTDYIVRDDTLSTGVTVSLSGPRDRAFVTHLGTIDSLTGADLPDELMYETRLVHVGSYFLQKKLQPDLPGVLARAHAAGAITSLDTGYDPYETWDSGLSQVLPHVDLFLPNEIEISAITHASDPLTGARELAAEGPGVALKLGGAGSHYVTTDNAFSAQPFRVVLADTTCCGDSFDAGFLTAWLQGKTPQECLEWGNACGALVASAPGNAADRLSLEAIQQVLTTGSVSP